MYNTNNNITVDFLKCILPILVVALHTSYISDLYWWTSSELFLRDIICKVGGVAVPTFFFISGYLFYSKLDIWSWNVWTEKLKRRIRTLLIPFVLWCVIAFVVKYIRGYLKAEISTVNLESLYSFYLSSGKLGMFYNRPILESTTNLLGYPINCDKLIDGPLWFIRDLIMMVVLSPLLHFPIKRIGKVWICFLAVLYLMNVGIPYDGFSPCAFFFFSYGAYFSVRKENIEQEFSRYRLLSYLLCVILLFVDMSLDATALVMLQEHIHRAFVIVSVIAVYNISNDLLKKNVVKPHKLLLDSSFFVYAIHGIVVLEMANFILWHLLPFENQFVFVLKVFLRPALAWCICIGIYLFMKKFMPRTLNVLTGGRG